MRSDRPVLIAGGGSISVDKLIVLDAELNEGKGRILSRSVSHGGMAATALIAASRLHANTRWLGFLPGGAEYVDLRYDLSSFGVDITRATEMDAPPIRSTILVTPTGERFIAFEDDSPIGFDAALDESVLDGVDALLVDQYSGMHAELVRSARTRGIAVVADVERPDWPGIDNIVDVADHLVVPLEFATARTGMSRPEDATTALLRSHHTAVVVTDGRNGAWYVESGDGSATHIPAFEVRAVDTTGCGDVFHGVYAVAIAQKQTIEEAVLQASAAGAICSTGHGGRGHLPDPDEIAELIATRQAWAAEVATR